MTILLHVSNLIVVLSVHINTAALTVGFIVLFELCLIKKKARERHKNRKKLLLRFYPPD